MLLTPFPAHFVSVFIFNSAFRAASLPRRCFGPRGFACFILHRFVLLTNRSHVPRLRSSMLATHSVIPPTTESHPGHLVPAQPPHTPSSHKAARNVVGGPPSPTPTSLASSSLYTNNPHPPPRTPACSPSVPFPSLSGDVICLGTFGLVQSRVPLPRFVIGLFVSLVVSSHAPRPGRRGAPL